MIKLIAITLLLGQQLGWAADTAILEFSIAVPNPVTAGDVVNFQAVAINVGSEQWNKGSYYWETEIFDVDKQYIGKTTRVVGDTDIGLGGPAPVNLSFSIPPNYGGFYFFRIYLYHNNIRIMESPYAIFKIIERSILAPAPPKVALGGSVIASYQNPNLPDPKTGQGNTVFNFVGKTDKGSYLFNAVNNHNVDTKWKSYILLGSYTTARGNVNLGDISPNFSALTVNGRGMRGIEMNANPEGKLLSNTRWSIVGGRAISAKSGSTTSDGTYERDIYGSNVAVDLPGPKIKAAIGIMVGLDNKASLSSDPLSQNFRGPALKPQSNQLAGLSLSYQPHPKLKLSGDFSLSMFKNNVDLSTSTSGAAEQFKAELSLEKISLSAGIRRTSPEFVSFGAPGITSDRLNYDAQATYKAATWSDIAFSFNQFSDNLGKDPKKTTSIQRAYSLGPSFSLPRETRVNTTVSRNTTQGSPKSALNNVSQSASVGISKSIQKHSMTVNFQNSTFEDINKVAHDLNTNTLALTFNLALPKDLRFSLGNSGSSTKDGFDGHTRNSNTQSASIGFPLIPSKASGQVWGTSTQSKDNGTSPARSQDWSSNTEFTWQIVSNFSFSLGGSYAIKEDLIRDTKTITKALNSRLSWNF